MDKNTEVVICLGSSCFARGNKKLLKIIQGYIKENHLESRVLFKGNHCFGKCNKGPNLRIGDNFYEQISESNLHEILKKELG
jgi:NADH:ubiquinone oxidoreductase subunit E